MKKDGITLVEMLTVIAIGGVILGLVSSVTIESLRSWRREENEFMSWRRANTFLNDFTRDAKSSIPGGFLGYDHSIPETEGGFAIKFSGDFFDFEEGIISLKTHTVIYRVNPESDMPFVVRESYLDGNLVSSRGYRSVSSFSLHREKTGLIRLYAYVSGGDRPSPIERKFMIPVHGIHRGDDDRI